MDQYVIKANGKEEEFSKEKINSSLLKAGANPEIAASTTSDIEKKFKNCINTDEIYRNTLDSLRKVEPKVALKYTLKRAIMDLGPAGFVFERYVSKILNRYGYNTEVDRIINGFCVDHEIDIIAEKINERFMIECKYHNIMGIHCDVKIALYINSRFLDIQKACNSKINNEKAFSNAWLFTNTKCTDDAIKYSNCVNQKITAWNYPKDKNLQYFIENKKLYPVTILSTISGPQKNILFNAGILMVNELSGYQINDLASLLSINKDASNIILNEANMLLN
jgi:hypothetical protein